MGSEMCIRDRLRIVDWFATNYAKQRFTVYNLTNGARFKVYNDYKLINDYEIPVHITYAPDDEDVPMDSILKAIKLVPEAKTFDPTSLSIC